MICIFQSNHTFCSWFANETTLAAVKVVEILGGGGNFEELLRNPYVLELNILKHDFLLKVSENVLFFTNLSCIEGSNFQYFCHAPATVFTTHSLGSILPLVTTSEFQEHKQAL